MASSNKKNSKMKDLLFPDFNNMEKAFNKARDLARDTRPEYKAMALEAFQVEIDGYRKLFETAEKNNITPNNVISHIGQKSYYLFFRHLVQATLVYLTVNPDSPRDALKLYYKPYKQYDLTFYSNTAMGYIKSFVEAAHYSKHPKKKTNKSVAK